MTNVRKYPVYAHHSADHVRVYQAYNQDIGQAAVAAGRLDVPGFSLTRMTWIKPSFLWMMYRCCWGQKDPGQNTVLQIDLKRNVWDQLLDRSCLSSFDRAVYGDRDTWKASLAQNPNRVQWDPERDFHHKPLDQRAIQVGISGRFVPTFMDGITAITDVTTLAHEMQALVKSGDLDAAQKLMPLETEMGPAQ